jgi:hypothetical protein
MGIGCVSKRDIPHPMFLSAERVGVPWEVRAGTEIEK